MAANATINILGADKTAQAFASVQNKLASLNRTSAEAGRALTKNLDVKDVFRTLAVAIGLSADKIGEKIARMVTGTSAEQEEMQQKALSLQETLEKAQRQNAAANNSSADTVKQLTREYENLKASIDSPGAKPAFGSEEFNKQLEKQIRFEEVISKLRDARSAQTSGEENYTAAIEKLGAAQSRVYSEKATLDEKMAGMRGREAAIMRKMAEADIADTKTRTKLVGELADVQERVSVIIKDQAEEAYRKAQVFRDAADIISYGFEDAIFSGQKLSEVIKQIGLDLVRMIFQKSVTAPLAGMISSGLSSFFGGPRAAGGPVGTGSSYLVGENGPELFVPSTAGRILNEHQMGGGGGGGGTVVNLNYNIASGVTRAELKPILEQQRAQLKREIPDAVRRGGSYRTAFA